MNIGSLVAIVVVVVIKFCHFTLFMTEKFQCPMCGTVLEDVSYDPNAQYWIHEPSGDICVIIGTELIRVSASPTPFSGNPTEVLHAH